MFVVVVWDLCRLIEVGYGFVEAMSGLVVVGYRFVDMVRETVIEGREREMNKK